MGVGHRWPASKTKTSSVMQEAFMVSIRTHDGQTQGYLFLMGIKPASAIRLREGMRLEPASCNPDPDAMIDSIMKHGSQNEIDLGLLIATLRLTSAQLLIESSDAKELAADLWNAQTDLCLTSALLHEEIYWTVQCDVEAGLFDETSSVHVVLPHRLFLPRDFVEIPFERCSYLESVFSNASKMMSNSSFSFAVNALWSYRQNLRLSVQMAILWAGIESLFGIRNELRFRISLLVAKFLDRGLDFYQEVKKLYDCRSSAVHNGSISDKEAVKATANLLHQIILKCVEVQKMPDEKTILFC